MDIAVPVICCHCQRRESIAESDCFHESKESWQRSQGRVERREALNLGKHCITKYKKKKNAKEGIVRNFKCCQENHTQDAYYN